MRHRNARKKLNVTSSHKRAMFRNLMSALFENELIRTTVPKAKEIRRYAEPLITLAKKDTLASRRIVYDRIRNRAAVTKLFGEIGPRYSSRNGGYIRVLKCGHRMGDSAPMAYVELVGRADNTSTT